MDGVRQVPEPPHALPPVHPVELAPDPGEGPGVVLDIDADHPESGVAVALGVASAAAEEG